MYAAVFLGVLALGVFLIAPRIATLGGSGPAPTDPPPAGLARPPVAVAEVPPPPATDGVELVVRGEAGSLHDGLHAVVGAELETLSKPADGSLRVRLRPQAPSILLGAPGHAWLRIPSHTLPDLDEVRLPAAAAPIVLRVEESDGSPAPDIPVRITPGGGRPVRRTDADGRLRIDDVPPGLVLVEVGESERRGPTLRLRAGVDEHARAELERAFVVVGRVVDADGRALAGARIVAFGADGLLGRPVFADAGGDFAWSGPVADHVALEVSLPGWAPTRVKARPPAAGTLVRDVGTVRLTGPSASLAGRITIEGRPAPGSVLLAEPEVAAIVRELFGADAVLDQPREILVDESGAFAAADLPPDLPLRLSVRGDGLPADHLLTLGPGEKREVVLDQAAGYTLRGRVQDLLRGAPAAYVPLLVSETPRDDDHALPDDRIVLTDAAGLFEVKGLRRGAVHLRAFLDRRRPLFVRVELPQQGELALELAEALTDAAHELRGHVVDDRQRPLAGVRVRAAGRVTTTDVEGAFTLAGVEAPAGAVVLRWGYEAGAPTGGVDPRPYAAGVRREVAEGAHDLVLELPRTQRLRLRAIDGIDEQPLAFAHVVLRTDDGDLLVDRAFAPFDGEILIPDLPTRGLHLALLTDVHRLVRTVPHATHADLGPQVDLGVVRIPRGIHLSGQVLDDQGLPVRGARIGGVEKGWLRDPSKDVVMRRELLLRHTEADDEGRFVLEGFDPREPAMLAVWAPGYAPTARRVVIEEFKDDVRTTLQLRVRRGGYFAVDLVDAGTEERISGALIDLEDARNGSDYLDLLRRGMVGGPVASRREWELVTEHFLVERREGSYRLGPVEPGPYEVWVDRPGYRSLKRKLTVLDPADGLIDLTQGTSRAIGEPLKQTWPLERMR